MLSLPLGYNTMSKRFNTAKGIQLKKSRVADDIASVTGHFSEECDPESVGLSAKQVKAIWSRVESLYRTGMYPAVSFCLRKRGKIVLNRGMGYQRGNGPSDGSSIPKERISKETSLCLFSASKMVTAMVIHGLAERGMLSLMDPVSYYLPKFAVTGKRDLTIHHLLTHRAGIPVMPTIASAEAFLDPSKVSDLVNALEPKWISGRGAGYHAVTSGFVLGEIALKVAKKDLRTLLAEMIQKPMGMRYFNFGVPAEDRAKVAMNYLTGVVPTPIAEGFLKRILGVSTERVVELSNDPRFQDAIIPAGNIMATAEEVSRFFQMMLNLGEYEGQQIFKPLTVRHAIQEVGKPEFDRMFLAPMQYSAGFMLGGNPIGLWGKNSAHAFGHIGFTNNFCWADRQRDIAVSLLTTGKPLAGPHLAALCRLIANIGQFCRPTVKF